MEGVGAVCSLLKAALEDENFCRELETTVEDQRTDENESFDRDSVRGGKPSDRRQRRRRSQLSIAGRIRITPHQNRTPDEKRWVALDAVVNPRLYHHVTLAEAEEMRWDALYYTRLDREDILRVLSLPHQIQLALPFLHTPNEVVAHELLGRYTLGISVDHFARLDKNSQDICVAAPPTATSLTTSSQTEVTDRQDGEGVAAVAIEEFDSAGASPRVLARMLRGVEAELKLASELDQEEAVWFALDGKLRPELYREEDEAEGDRVEEMHREADAREDARNIWLRSGDKTTPGRISDGSLRAAVGLRGNASPGPTIKVVSEGGGGGAGMVTDCETVAVRVANAFSEKELERLVGEMLGPSRTTLVGVSQEPQGSVPAADTDTAEVKKTEESPKIVNRANGVAETVEGKTREGSSGTSDDGGSDRGRKRSVSAGASIPGKIAAPEPAMSSEIYQDHGAVEDKTADENRLEDLARAALSRFLVREEETPVGRCMTQSLAMLQEVTLRLSRGQRGLFAGLNQHTALAAVISHTPHFSSSCSSGTATVTTPSPPPATISGKVQSGAKDEGTVSSTDNITMSHAAESASLPVDPRTSDEYTPPKTSPERSSGTCQRASSTGSGAAHRRGGERSGRRDRDSDVGCRTWQGPAKIFGSWEEIHPASLGAFSQEKEFGATGDARESEERVHPGSYRGGKAQRSVRVSKLMCFR